MKPNSLAGRAAGALAALPAAFRNRLRGLVSAHRVDLPALLSGSAALGLCLLLILLFGPGSAAPRSDLGKIEVGRIAESDIVADRELRFVDAKATELRIEAEERLVLAVFLVDEDTANRASERFRRFQDLLNELATKKLANDTFFLSVQREFPGLMPKDQVLAIATSPFRAQAFAQADSMLRKLMGRGIASLPTTGLERFNSDYVELRRLRDGRVETEEVPTARLVTLKNLGEMIDAELTDRHLSRSAALLAASLVKSFAVENTFFDAAQSVKRLEAVRSRVEPVIRTIAKGERIVRKGTIVSEAEAARVAAAKLAISSPDWGAALGSFGLLGSAFALALFVLGKSVSGASLKRRQIFIVGVVAFCYFAAALLLGRFLDLQPLAIACLLPTALFSMILAIMAGSRFAVLFSLVLSLLAAAGAGLDAPLLAFCLLSGAAATFSARAAHSRVDLVRAGIIQALFGGGAAALLALPGSSGGLSILIAAAWGAGNGFACGLLALGLLPILEQALNVPTRFRLMELSDLNAPILKRLLTVAPGTYSHSVTVAHLAESASREIGADPLLSRVGAYYHDIGKIEQPEYFVENQSGYNKHDELNPRLSATVIRSHVKIGAERARSLGLPEAIVDIVAQHHGNAVIAFFLDQARKAEGSADADDFTYPGQPPSSKEAAVVMLADAVEAATRTLKKPTMSRLEDFIRDIILDKVRQGQLDRCDLTFKDLETIRNCFTRILAGHFHSRIEYPKLREQTR